LLLSVETIRVLTIHDLDSVGGGLPGSVELTCRGSACEPDPPRLDATPAMRGRPTPNPPK
jgi:hypothetical protein